MTASPKRPSVITPWLLILSVIFAVVNVTNLFVDLPGLRFLALVTAVSLVLATALHIRSRS